MAQTAKINWNFYAIVLASLAVVFGYWLVIVPQLNGARSINTEIAVKKAEVADADARLKTIDALDQTIKKNSQDFDLLSLAIPTDSDVGGALVTLEALAPKTGVSLISIDPGKPEPAQGLLPVVIRVESGYKNLIDFMIALQKNVRPISVQTVTVAALSGGNGNVNATLALQFSFAATPSSDSQAPQGQSPTQAEPLLPEP